MILDFLQRESSAIEMDTDVSVPLHSNPYDQLAGEHMAEATLAAYEQAIQLAPREGILYYHKARALEELGRVDEAQETYQEAQRLGYSD